MKTNLLVNTLVGIIAAIALQSCSTEIEEQHYVRLDQVTCSFQSTDNIPLTIDVETSPVSWKAVPEASWLSVTRSDDGLTLTIEVDDNTAETERSANILITAGKASQSIQVYQLGSSEPNISYRKFRSFLNGVVVSPSGKYIGGIETALAGDNEISLYPVIIDLSTGDRFRGGPYSSLTHNMNQPWAITDQGQMFMSDPSANGMSVDLDDKFTTPEPPADIPTQAAVQGVSADGSIWVGYAHRNPSGGVELYTPLIWKNGQAETLPLPDKNMRGMDFTTGVMARGVSADGEVIYGTTWDDTEFGMVYWKNGKVEYVGHDLHEIFELETEGPDGTETYIIANGITCQAENFKISPSGNWIAGIYNEWTITDDVVSSYCTKYPAFFNTDTEKTTVIKDYGAATGMHATDDGTAFIALGTYKMTSGVVYDLNTGTDLGTTEEWVYDNYGIVVPSGYIQYLSPDKKVILGRSAYPSLTKGVEFENWCIIPYNPAI